MNSRQIVLILGVALVFGVIGYYSAMLLMPPEPAPQEIVMTKQPETLPDFLLYNLEGKPVTRADFQGKAVMVNFWATWCAPCRREIPVLIDMQQKYGDQGVQIIGIAIDNREDVAAYLREFPVNYPILLGEMELDAIETANAMGVDVVGLPITLTTDKSGRILEVHPGELDETEAEALIRQMLSSAGKTASSHTPEQ